MRGGHAHGILPAGADPDAVRSLTTLLSQLPDAEPQPPVTDSTQLVDTLARFAAESVDELPEWSSSTSGSARSRPWS